MDGAIRLEGVSKRYRLVRQRPFLARAVFRRVLQRPSSVEYHWALRDVDLEVERGTSVGVIGANGSGKSTLLALVARTTYPTEGTVEVAGRVGPLLDLGAGFHPDLTGFENVYLNASLLGLARSEVDRRIDSIIDYSGLAEFIHSPLHTFSTGMVARLGFAVLAHIEPEVLLVDEALSVGDAQFQAKGEETMQRFVERGTTLLLVSHDLDLIEKLCQRLVWIDGGSIRASGTPADVLPAYREAMGAAAVEEHAAV